MIDERTGGRGYPLPHLDNTMAEDLPRIRQSLVLVDGDVAGTALEVQRLRQSLDLVDGDGARTALEVQRLARQTRMKDLLGISFT